MLTKENTKLEPWHICYMYTLRRETHKLHLMGIELAKLTPLLLVICKGFFHNVRLYFFLQPPTKRINHTTITNTAGDSVLAVGVILNEGTNNLSSTKLDFTVNIPKTGFFNFFLRYMVRVFPSCRPEFRFAMFCKKYGWCRFVKSTCNKLVAFTCTSYFIILFCHSVELLVWYFRKMKSQTPAGLGRLCTKWHIMKLLTGAGMPWAASN